MIYFTSDPHLGHTKNFLWEPRGFNSSEEHDAAFVNMWNTIVKPDDEVYILGDLVVGDLERGYSELQQLSPCKVHIILGNHDSETKIARYQDIFGSNLCTLSYADVIKWHKHIIYLSHYPTMTGNFDDEKPFKTHVLNFHGHTHSQTPFYNDSPLCLNVGLDAHKRLLTIEEAIEMCREFYEKMAPLDKNAKVCYNININ